MIIRAVREWTAGLTALGLRSKVLLQDARKRGGTFEGNRWKNPLFVSLNPLCNHEAYRV